jgi:hypothetical protein
MYRTIRVPLNSPDIFCNKSVSNGALADSDDAKFAFAAVTIDAS